MFADAREVSDGVSEFANVLNEMRVGRLTPESIALFRKLSRPVHYDDDIEATEL